MDTLITNGIKISVETFYQDEYSRPIEHKYIFAYRITIENLSPHTIQLLRRHWHIFDSNGILKEVEGEGVVGQQPVLPPGESHQYISWCQLGTDSGKMSGTYTMERQSDGDLFQVEIPSFRLTAPFKAN
jgi:ApaG protein